MALETLYADAHITGNVKNPDNALGPSDNLWAGDVNVNTSFTSRWSIGNVVNPLKPEHTLHEVAVFARKGTNTNNPTISITLFESGTAVRTLISDATVTSPTLHWFTGTFSTSEIENADNIEVGISVTGVGGSPTARNSAQIDSIRVTVDTQVSTVPVMKRWNGTAWDAVILKYGPTWSIVTSF